MDNQRERIKAIDRLLIRTLNERVEIGKEIARIKSDRDLPVEDEAQEQQVIDRAREYAAEQIGDCEGEIEEVFEKIIELTKSKMEEWESPPGGSFSLSMNFW